MASDIDEVLGQARARLDLAAAAVDPGAELGYSIANVGETPLLYGAGYRFERRTAEGWDPVPIAMQFPLWGHTITPGEDSEAMVARVPSNQASGRYRLVTSVIVLGGDGVPMSGSDGPAQIDVACEFSILG